MGLGFLVWFFLLFLGIFWWDTTPILAIGVLLLIPIFVFWLLLMLAYLGRWGRRAVVILHAPPWFWWLWWLFALVFFGLGFFALIDGSESRAGVLLLVLGAIFAAGGWARMMMVIFRMMPFPVLIPLLALIAGGTVLGVLGLLAVDEVLASIALLGATIWLVGMVAAPWWTLWQRGVRHQRFPGGLPVAMLIAPLLVLLVALVMLATNGYTVAAVSAPVRSGDLLVESGGEVVDSPEIVSSDDEVVTSSSEPVDDVGPVQQQPTHMVLMSDGRAFPVYRFDDGSRSVLGIVLDVQAECWVLQYAENDADRVGTCSRPFLGSAPAEATILYTSETSVIALVRDESQLVVSDFASNGISPDLPAAFFVTIDDSGEFELDGESFGG